MPEPRLDILLYAHDGRGIGHASRTIAIGMALRRLHPGLRVLFISGTPHAQELRGASPLDWIKLPGYETVIREGISRGSRGMSNFEDRELGTLRATMLKQVVTLYRPRLILADHSPYGKHRELLPALEASLPYGTEWILGVRGVVGNVRQVHSASATEIFSKYYRGLLWYGDSNVLGTDHRQRVAKGFGCDPVETGYVARMAELEHSASIPPSRALYTGTLAIPWLGEKPDELFTLLSKVLPRLEAGNGRWKIFLPRKRLYAYAGIGLGGLEAIPGCELAPFGPEYHKVLLSSRVAVIFGGYNSLTDVLYAGLPTVVLERNMEDAEQQLHLQRLARFTDNYILSLPERDLQAETLYSMLRQQLQKSTSQRPLFRVNLHGAGIAADYLATLL